MKLSKKCVLGVDLGVPNTAYTIKNIYSDGSYEILACNMLQNTINNLTNDDVIRKRRKKKTFHRSFKSQLNSYYKEVYDIHLKYPIDMAGYERFIGRGFTPGAALPETISMMIAIWVMVARRRRAEYYLFAAASWKNELKRQLVNINVSLDDIYVDAKEFKLTPHQIDSSLISSYTYDKKDCFAFLIDNDDYFEYLESLAKAKG